MSAPEDQPPSTPGGLPTSGPSAEGKNKNEQTMGMLCHLTALSKYLAIPFGNIIGPLIVWTIKREEMPFVESQGKESLNFQISMTIYMAIAGILCFVLIGIPILIGLAIFDVIFVVLASIETANGKPYRYPLCIRFIQ